MAKSRRPSDCRHGRAKNAYSRLEAASVAPNVKVAAISPTESAGLVLLAEPCVYAEYKALPIPIGTASGNNAYIERFKRTYREEVLDLYLFDTLAEARAITEAWLEAYNAIRPHEALGGLTPYKYAAVVGSE